MKEVVTMPKDPRDLTALEAKIKKLDQNTPLSHRLRRSFSWLERAAVEKDTDAKCIFLWVSFNAAYATDLHAETDKLPEWQRRERYFDELTRVGFRIDREVQESLSVPIAHLMNNEYIFWGFWDTVSRSNRPFNWKNWKGKKKFEEERGKVGSILTLTDATATDMRYVLERVFNRLYVLRNQLMHGCSTHRSDAKKGKHLNHRQVENGAKILETLIPLFLSTMANHPDDPGDEKWGKISYPVRDDIREDRRH